MSKKYWDYFILAVIVLLAAAVRLYHFSDWLYFAMDQARDAMLIREAYDNGISNLPLLGSGRSSIISNFFRRKFSIRLIRRFLLIRMCFFPSFPFRFSIFFFGSISKKHLLSWGRLFFPPVLLLSNTRDSPGTRMPFLFGFCSLFLLC
ncbi:MAG: hypothetical protein UW66_C0004G0002 [Candidatus Moranbacteria bacterium GW2011_GWF1_44_4]|nr:MAG: hypothetical protein UW66_C0004G0002 [Candidatus Moranbacteria bacterium GW2011_GWF1_44_4]